MSPPKSPPAEVGAPSAEADGKEAADGREEATNVPSLLETPFVKHGGCAQHCGAMQYDEAIGVLADRHPLASISQTFNLGLHSKVKVNCLPLCTLKRKIMRTTKDQWKPSMLADMDGGKRRPSKGSFPPRKATKNK
uniref:Uncharacterized protein n=1 Tax=Plectus sambesii TaxID=2011161 RepID=A0A914X4T2_9BILA